MNFSAWAIRKPIAPLLAFAMLLLLGWQSFNTLPITRFPNIDVPLVAVTVAQEGAAPAELETQVTKEIEDAVAGIAGVKNVNSTISDGMSQTLIEFRMEVPTDQAVQDVKDAIDQIVGDLPGDIEAPTVTRIDVEGQAILTFAVSSPDMSIEELSWFVDDTISRALQGRPGIGRIDRYGGADREIRIELDPARLDSYGITAAMVNAQLRETNANLGAGRGKVGGQEQAIRALGDAASADSLADTTIALPSGRFVRLGDLGEVIDTYEEPRSFVRVDGKPVVTFAVFRAKGASEVSVAETVNATLADLRAAHPEVSITLADDTVFYTYGNYEAALHTLFEGALLAVLVVLLFLRNWRATLITAVALPLSAIPTFWLMDLLGFSLNLVSFLAITLATGILVDDAIVEIENISRHIRMGKTPYRAAVEAADEIGLAVIATTMTIVAVFVPVSFMPGIPGQYFRQFGLTVAIAVIFSLLVARLITPMMAAYLMRDSDAADHGEPKDGPFMRAYLWLVRTTLRARYLTLLAAIGVLAVSLFFMLRIPGSFIPPEDVSRIPISVELPPGATLAETEVAVDRVRELVGGVEGVDSVFVLGGASPTGDLDVRRASVTALLEKLDHSILRKLASGLRDIPVLGALVPEIAPHGRLRPQSQIEAEIFDKLATVPDIRAFKLNDRGERDLSFSVLSSDEASLAEAVGRLEAALRGDPLLADVASEGALPRPEIQVTPRLAEAARLGVTTRQIAETVRVATIGDIDAALAKVSVDDRLIPVRVQLSEDVRTDIGRIAALKVTTASGATVPLNAVADVVVAEGPNSIERLNRQRLATIGANLPPGVALGTASARFNELTRAVELPPGVRIAEAGDAEIQAEMQQSFGNAMVMGLMLVLTVLILLFHSVIQPFTILFSLPLALGGVAAALIVTGNAISMPVLIGFLMLMGIVTKNAILLVDFAIEMRAQGMDRVTALIEAGHKRARPIVMTSIAMSAGMLPSALGVGEGGAFRAPMAIAVIGGIIVSTLLSLVVVPSFFLIMDDLQRLLARVFGRFVGRKEPDPETRSPEEVAAALTASESEIDALRQRIDRLENPPPGGRSGLHVA
ncbi:efflux RND transporter permease subunit [Amaricoccus sp.]|uniref:efflux RND transporter permease subunit n=1 Tax=Amaricoccus sp. TaxID=1872485 RepID=UPI001B7AC1D8|nr:efflux RND transporter permease subunit [Amaricoccus sp.]MBP7002877.1 efflux RND transporter permease subunit [Amaricoccus sp.]